MMMTMDTSTMNTRYNKTIVACIKAIYILIGKSDLTMQQGPVLFDNLEDMVTPSEFVVKVLQALCSLGDTIGRFSSSRILSPSPTIWDSLPSQYCGSDFSSQTSAIQLHVALNCTTATYPLPTNNSRISSNCRRTTRHLITIMHKATHLLCC